MTPNSIDCAVMEGAAADHRVVMGTMGVGWSNRGTWTALPEARAADAGADARGASGRVLQPADPVEAGPGDLVVRPVDGRLVVDEPAEGRIVPDAVWAHLSGARHLEPEIRVLLDRVQRQETRA